MLGFRWLCHRSRHCFGFLPGIWAAICFQRLGPFSLTRYVSLVSSLMDHELFMSLTKSDFRRCLQRCKHWWLLRPWTCLAILHQFPAPYFSSAIINWLSYSLVQWPLTISGLRTMFHLLWHYCSVLPPTYSEIAFQFLAPLTRTACLSFSSSSSVQCPFTRTGSAIFYHLYWHWSGALSSIISATFYQLLVPCFSTACRSLLSS